MIHLKTTHALLLLTLGLVGAPAQAATTEPTTIGDWSLASEPDTTSGATRTCVLTTAAGEGTELTVKLSRDRWSLGLKRADWPFEVGEVVVATLNVDTGRRAPLAIEARRRAEAYLALPLPADVRLPDLLSGASTLRIALEHRIHVEASLAGFDRAVDAIRACAARRGTPEASARAEGRVAPETRAAPDARIEGETNDHNDATIEIEGSPPRARPRTPVIPAAPVRPKPAAPGDLIEASAPAAQPTPHMPESMPVVAVVPAAPLPGAGSDAAHASTTAILGPAPSGHDLVPMLMQAAKRTDFELLADAHPPVSLTRADTVFRLAGFTGATAAFEMPTAAASLNEVLAHDRIACSGAYAAQIAPVVQENADVMRATSRCEAAGLVTVEHFLTLARKGGGFYVLAMSSAGPAGTTTLNPLRDVSAALDDAALAITGRF